MYVSNESIQSCFHPHVGVRKMSVLNCIITEPGNLAIAFRDAHTVIIQLTSCLPSEPEHFYSDWPVLF